MRLIGYVRISKDDPKSHSPERQARQIERWCLLRDYELIDVVSDNGVSGDRPLESRESGGALIARLKRGEADGFVSLCLDRAFRNTIDGLTTADWFNRRGLKMNFTDDLIDTATPDGYWLLTVKLANAKLERDRTSKRCSDTYSFLKEEGRCFGGVPYGLVTAGGEQYKDPDTGRHRTKGARLFKDPQTWPVRDRIVRMYRDGAEGFSGGLRPLVKRLKKEGIPAPGGGNLWPLDTLSRIVKTHHELEHIPLLGGEPPHSAGGAA